MRHLLATFRRREEKNVKYLVRQNTSRGNLSSLPMVLNGVYIYVIYPIIRQYTTASRVINEYTTGGDQMVSNLLGKKVYACDLK